MSSELRCNGCAEHGVTTWFPADQGGCEICGWEPAPGNKHLRTAKLNDHLYSMAERSVNAEKAYQRSVGEEIRQAKRMGWPVAPPKPLTRRDLGWAT